MREGINRFGRTPVAAAPRRMLYKKYIEGEDRESTTANVELGLLSYVIVDESETKEALAAGWFKTQEDAASEIDKVQEVKPSEQAIAKEAPRVEKSAAEAPKVEVKKSFGGFGKVGTPRQGK